LVLAHIFFAREQPVNHILDLSGTKKPK